MWRHLDDAEVLREVMNTVGRKGRLGEQVRCIVSVSMLTEGWDANTVTHILAAAPLAHSSCASRSWGAHCGACLTRSTQDRACSRLNTPRCWACRFRLRRAAAAGPPTAAARDPRQGAGGAAEGAGNPVSERRRLPRRVSAPAAATGVHRRQQMELTPDDVPNVTESEPLIGEGITFDLRKDAEKLRLKSVAFDVAGLLLREKFPRPGLALSRTGADRRAMVREMPDDQRQDAEAVPEMASLGAPCRQPHLHRSGRLAHRPGRRLARALLPIVNPYNSEGSTRHVDFTTSKQTLIATRSRT